MTKHRAGKPAASDPETGGFKARARRERTELRALKEEGAGLPDSRAALKNGGTRYLRDRERDESVQEYVRSLAEKREQRKYQLSLIKDFVGDPGRFGLETDAIPTSTTSEDLGERRKEIEYRIALAKTFLEMMEEELKQLEKAEIYARNRAADSPT